MAESYIPRENWNPSKFSVVCEKHFYSSKVIKDQHFFDENGNVRTGKRAKLKEGVVPHIFPDCPIYLSTTNKARSDPAVRKEKIEKRLKEVHEEEERRRLEDDIISSRSEYQQKLPLTTLALRNIKTGDEKLYFYILSDDCLRVKTTVQIDAAFEVRVWKAGIELSYKELMWILPKTLKITKWSQIDSILKRYANDCRTDEDFYSTNLHQAIKCLTVIKKVELGNENLIAILLNQLQFC